MLLAMLLAISLGSFATNYVVSGAGSTEVNGTYIEDGTWNGKPIYKYNDGSNDYAIGWENDGWIVGSDFGVFIDRYYRVSSTADTPPATGWEREMMGVDPAPTVAVEGKGLSYSATVFFESNDNDGSITTVITITHNNFDSETFTGNINDNYITAGKATATNVPAGLTANVKLTSSTTVEFTLTGNATAHANANDIANLTLIFDNTAFTGGDASAVSNSTKADLELEFFQIIHVPADYGTIELAINNAEDLDIIQIAAGTYTEAGLTVDKELTFKGESAATTIVQAHANFDAATDRVFYIPGSVEKVIFKNLTIRHGKMSSAAAMFGGGIYSLTSLEMYNCIITRNKLVTTAQETRGAGVYTPSSLLLENCLISENVSSSADVARGGGVYAAASSIINCTFTGNSISGTQGQGSALYVTKGEIINNTITANTNSATTKRGGVYAFLYGALNMKNTIIYGNTGGDMETYTNSSEVNVYNSIIETTVSGDGINGDNVNVSSSNPLLSALADNGGPTQTCAIGTGSPAINAGTTGTDIPETDQRGYSANSTRDIGAFEYNGLTKSTWNGSSWSNGAPDEFTIVEITNSFTTSEAFACYDLTINNLATFTANHAVTVNGDLFLESNATGTASLIGQQNLSVTGNITVQRYAPVANQYYYLGAPISNAVANDEFATATGLYFWDETVGTWAAGLVDPASATNIIAGRGYACKFDAETTLNNTGNLNNTNVAVTISNTSASSFTGFNLLGNPFTSAIDWENAAWDKTNLEGNTIWIMTGAVGSRVFATYNADTHVGANGGSQYIPVGQAFWVNYNNTDNSRAFTIPTLAQTHSTAALLKSANTNPVFRVVLENQQAEHETVITLNAEANNFFDRFDSRLYATNNSVSEIYTFAADQDIPLTINSVDASDFVRIPLGADIATANQHTIRISDTKEIPEEYDIYLFNKANNQYYNLATQQFIFEGIIGKTDDKYEIIIYKSQNSTTGIDAVKTGNSIYSYNKQVYVSSESNNYIVKIFDLSGKLILSTEKLSGNSQLSVNQTGVFIVKLIENNRISTKRISI